MTPRVHRVREENGDQHVVDAGQDRDPDRVIEADQGLDRENEVIARCCDLKDVTDPLAMHETTALPSSGRMIPVVTENSRCCESRFVLCH